MDENLAAPVHGFEGVLHDVEEGLLDLITVRHDQRDVVGDVDGNAYAQLATLVFQKVHGLRNDGDEVGVY